MTGPRIEVVGMMNGFTGTTVVAVKRDGKTAMAADGQVTFQNATIMKHHARKVRKIYNDRVLVGFAGAVADAFTLFERLEGKLEEYRGNLQRAAVSLAKDWRSDKVLRRLEALLIAADADHLLVISGTGEVVEPDESVAAIGSGGPCALAAARALMKHTGLASAEIAREAIHIAADICVYTNHEVICEELT